MVRQLPFARMEPVALDVQALQEGSGADPGRRRRVAQLAARLQREGRLAAALIAPELPPPDRSELPPELLDEGNDLLRWDTRPGARALLRRHPGLQHHVPAPLLRVDPDDPGGMVVSRHWGDAGIARVVHLEPEDVARLSPPRTPRLDARLAWIRQSDQIVGDEAARALAARREHPAGDEHWPGDEHRPEQSTSHSPDQGPEPPYLLAVVGPFPPGGGGIGAYNARFVTAVAASGLADVDAVTVSGMGWDPPAGVDLVHIDSFGTDIRPASYDWVVYTLGNSDGHLPTIQTALRHPGWIWLHEARLPAVATTAFEPLDDSRFGHAMASLLERAYPGRAPLAAARTAGRSHLALAAGGVGLTAPLVERAAGLLVNSTAAEHALELDLPPMAWRPPITVLPPACPAPPEVDRAAEAGLTAEVDPTTLARSRASDLIVAFGVVSMGKRPDLLVDAAALAGCRLAFVGPCPEILHKVIADRATARGIAERVEVTGRQDDAAYWARLRRATVAVQLRDSAGGEMSAAVLDALAAGVPVLTNLPSAADYPPGTVALLPDASPEAGSLAEAIAALVGREGGSHRAALAAAGQAFAQAHRMEDLAETVIGVLRSGL